MNLHKQQREEIARALILCANAYLEMDMDSSDDDMDLMLEHDSSIKKDRTAKAALTIPKWSGDEYMMYLKEASATFNMTKSTGYICTHRVINALHTLAPAFIRWPSVDQAKVIAKDFEAINGFPGVVGNVGCCELRMLDFMDKALEGVMLQIICDSKKSIIHCNIAPAGSNLQSGIEQYLNEPTKIPKNTHLIANNTYSLQENLMVPYLEEKNEAQKKFNKKIRSSFVINFCFGELLGRFGSLTRGLTLNEKLNERHVNACCVLHNICILKGDVYNSNGIDLRMKESYVACSKGVRKRDAIASQFSKG